ncbi:ABC-2 type transport system permease protein [Candidatus Magnetomoraceae bacterium gMMP-15]
MKLFIPKKHLDNNQLILQIVLIFTYCIFIFVQFYSIYFRYHNHQGPIGMGDASYYISRIAFFKEHNTFSRPNLFDLTDEMRIDSNDCVFNYYIFYGLVSSYAFGKLSAYLDISAEQMFHINFYIGIFVMSIILFFLLLKIKKDLLFLIIGFLIFSFYTGNGSYHGFFWIVPSFYSLLFLYLTIIVFFYTKKWYIFSPFTIFLLLFSHPLSLFCIALLSLALFINGLLEKTIIQSIFKILYIILWFIFFFGIYKYLLRHDLIFPLFAENLNFQTLLSFEGKGYHDLWNATPFSLYFAGIFLPLTIGSLIYCFKNKEFILISLLISSFIGLMLFCLIHPFASRSFLYFENILIIVLIAGVYYSIKSILNYQPIILTLKNHIVRQYLFFLFNGTMLLLSFCLILFFVKTKLMIDAGHRFQHSVFFKSNDFIKYTNRNNTINILDSLGSGSNLLHLDGYWDKKLIKSCMLPSILDSEIYKNEHFIGANYKLYETKREGIGIYLPRSGKILLKSKLIQPGSYKIILSDTGLQPQEIEKLKLELHSKKNKVLVPINWTNKLISITHPEKDMYPKLMPPYYSVLIWYLKNRTKEGFLIIRKTNQYSIEFTIKQPYEILCLKNYGNTLNFKGTIEIVSLSKNISVYRLDTDSDSAQKINLCAAFSFDKKIFPLLWKDPKTNMKVKISQEHYVPTLFTLSKNFQDIKAFKLFIEPFEFISEEAGFDNF